MNNIDLEKKALECLADGVKYNDSLKKLDLSYCGIQDKYATQVGKLITEQGELREARMWQRTLRDSEPDQSSKIIGLTEFVFHHNFLGA